MSGEFFYTDKNGNKQDASLHEDMLNTPNADQAVEITRHRVFKEYGTPIETIENIYGPFINRPTGVNGESR